MTFGLRLGAGERRLLAGLLAELRALVEADAPDAARLFPAAYRDDPEAAAEYDRLMRGELAAGRLAAIREVEQTLEADELAREQAEAWCGVLNDLRLVWGERLGVTEDVDLERAAMRDERYAIYAWLTWRQSELVDALARPGS